MHRLRAEAMVVPPNATSRWTWLHNNLLNSVLRFVDAILVDLPNVLSLAHRRRIYVFQTSSRLGVVDCTSLCLRTLGDEDLASCELKTICLEIRA